MTFTYDNTLASSLDTVRFRIGDTDSSVAAQQRLEDEEIEATIAAQPNFAEAMAQCAEALAAKFFRHATTKQAASLKVSYEKRVDSLLSFAERLRNGSEAIGLAEIIITGTTIAEIDETKADTSIVQSAFCRGQFDNPDGVTLAEETA